MFAASDVGSLPFKAYEPTIEIRDRKSRSVFVEASFTVETGEAERIAVDWTARGGERGTSRKSTRNKLCPLLIYITVESHLQTQRAAVKMLHDRILLLVKYVTDVIAGITFMSLCLRILNMTYDQAKRKKTMQLCVPYPP